MKTVDIKGKPYVMVNERLIYFNEHYKNGRITTDLVEMTERYIVKATVTPDTEIPERYFTGLAEEGVGSSQINKTSALENCETSAVGRALAKMGIGVLQSIASADEVATAIYQQDEAEITGMPIAEEKVIAHNGLHCPLCKSAVWDNRVSDKDGNMVVNEKRQPAFNCKENKCDFHTWETDPVKAGVKNKDDEDLLSHEFVTDENLAEADKLAKQASDERIPY